MNKKIYKEIILTVLVFIAMFGIVSLLAPVMLTMEKYLSIMLFLAIMAITIIWRTRKNLLPLISQAKTHEAIVLVGISFLIHALTIFIIKNYATQPTWPFESTSTSFLLLNNYFIWTKPMDVFIQQLLIILFVLRLKFYKLTTRTITWFFFFGFGLAHLVQMFRTDLIIGFLFTVAAIVFSFIFPFMILKVKNGYIYNYMLHLATYDVAALIAWFLY